MKFKHLDLRDVNLLCEKNELDKSINIKVRSTGKLLKAKINIESKFGKVEILDDETGISPGQACVFYSKNNLGERLLGGGWIDKTFNKKL